MPHTTIVTMHFGDGSFKQIEVEETNRLEAEESARTWVADNAWFECDPDQEGVTDDE